MACLSCQERRKIIARMLKDVGSVVFGGKKRKLATPQEPPPEDQNRGERRA
jgi:2-phospho-L-lactate guanylyltransferase (CobY/MobA/RfbA family)